MRRGRRRRRHVVGVLLASLSVWALGASCATEGGLLEGSLGEFYDLSFTSMRARLYSSELSIEWARSDGEVPVRITVRRSELDPKGPRDVDLKRYGDVSGSSRGTPIPRFTSGTLTLSDYRPKDGAVVSGSADITFRAADTEVTLSGEFYARLTVVPE